VEKKALPSSGDDGTGRQKSAEAIVKCIDRTEGPNVKRRKTSLAFDDEGGAE
jgi:hypothetical protein